MPTYCAASDGRTASVAGSTEASVTATSPAPASAMNPPRSHASARGPASPRATESTPRAPSVASAKTRIGIRRRLLPNAITGAGATAASAP